MSEEVKNDLKAAAVFVFGLHQNPVVEISKLCNVKAGGMFLPAIDTQVVVAGGNLTSVKFPILACDVMGEGELEKFRENLHSRIDKTIDNYKEKWAQRTAQMKAPSDEPKEETNASVDPVKSE